ncbi:hypothetical protein FNF28_05568 [Cafeteria roenbergensis]|uniref:K Homology domain-containing protein n=1 Tax=Cafeteria roenbergensis TaxID=33653 RepID=A0A5A8D537_CAFRO|nr:hypothetical protein FNF28_05568 [Cafeteria roenbergensis]
MQSSSSHPRGGHGSGGGGSGGGGGSAHPAVPPGMGLERGHGHGHGHGAYAPGGAPAGPRPPAPDQLEAPTGVHGGGYPASSAGGHPGGPPHGYSGAHPGYQPGPEAYGAAGYPAGYGHAPQGYSAPPGYAPYPSSYGQAGYGDGHHDGGVPSSAAEYSEAYGAGGGSGGGYGGAPEGTEFTQQQQAQFARSFGYSGPSGPYRPAFATVPSGPGYDRPWARAPAAPAVSIVPQHAEQIDVPRDLVDWVTSGGWAELEEQLTTSLSDRLHIEGATLSLSSHRPGAAIITVSVPGHLAVALRAFIPLAHAILGHQQHRIREEQETRRLREDYEAAMREQELGLRAEFTVPTEVLGLVIGKQGANINRVRTETGVDRIVTEDDGTVRVRGPSREHVALARSLLEFTVEDLHISPQQAARLRDREEGLDRVRRDTGVVRLELVKNVLRPMDGAKAETEPGSARGPAVRVTGLKSAVVGCIALLTEEMRFEEEAALRRSQQRKQQRELESIDRAYGDLAPARRGGKDRRAGAVLMVVLVAGQESNVTLAGDMVALLGAAAMAVYLSAGRHYRAELKLPLFLYAAPVTLFAAISLSAASLAIEGPSHGVALSTGPARLTLFGWLVDGRLALLVCALGLVSGILGHTLANLSLARLPSLVVSVSLLLEPVVGSLIGYAAGVQAVPHAWTFVGGAVLLVGAGMVTVGGKRDSAPHDPAPAQQSHPAEIELSV